MSSKVGRQRGFTLIELLVTVLIVGTLSSVVLPMAHLASHRSKETQLRQALQQIRGGIDAYKRAADSGKIVLQSGESGYPPNLDALVRGVPDAQKKGSDGKSAGAMMYFLRRIPRDPLSEDNSIPADKTWGKRSYQSPAEDPKEGKDLFDVYSLSTGIGINGQPYKQW